MKSEVFKAVKLCPLCQCDQTDGYIRRSDDALLLRCLKCRSIFLEKIPTNVHDFYADNYFALSEGDDSLNKEQKVGYEGSYETGHLDSEFYWAFRFVDYIHGMTKSNADDNSVLDIGCATGRLLNIFKTSGYETFGIEFSVPACNMALGRGHHVFNQPVQEVALSGKKFSCITALEVIEHLDDLDSFFQGVKDCMAEDAIFFGYFPSSDERYFGDKPSYHWLHSSFEHLVYPSVAGIETKLVSIFGDNVFSTTFFTRQGGDVIPNTLVLIFKGKVLPDANVKVVELFRQFAYLNSEKILQTNGLPVALFDHWRASVKQEQCRPDFSPFFIALICAKFGSFVPSVLLQDVLNDVSQLTPAALHDVLITAMHEGRFDFIRSVLSNQKLNSNLLPNIRIELETLTQFSLVFKDKAHG